MKEILAESLKMMVKTIKNHGDRIKLLEEGEDTENSDEADLMEEVTSLLAKLQTPESGLVMESVPSDQI